MMTTISLIMTTTMTVTGNVFDCDHDDDYGFGYEYFKNMRSEIAATKMSARARMLLVCAESTTTSSRE